MAENAITGDEVYSNLKRKKLGIGPHVELRQL